jgi:hypothetical protein
VLLTWLLHEFKNSLRWLYVTPHSSLVIPFLGLCVVGWVIQVAEGMPGTKVIPHLLNSVGLLVILVGHILAVNIIIGLLQDAAKRYNQYVADKLGDPDEFTSKTGQESGA